LLSAGQGTDRGTFANESKSTRFPALPFQASWNSIGENTWQFRADILQGLVVADYERVRPIGEFRIAHLAFGDIRQFSLRATLNVIEIDFQLLRGRKLTPQP
jgi:hypothetical protein